ncbi:MinD/ParA family protein [Desulfovibrio ferrophilus]|uniref:Flagellar synthesis regulator FleN n=1 Tax=Desulfovibrio ferrophilus TaxID=241368 RepID=A0A2Z6AWF4_9BACT|nr:MinD/ParA family protein [Desulfovibrio ferrophilus]BBD07587.1 flagellar synthesis regulator FleN [Desulfovibrio ferrophilus]
MANNTNRVVSFSIVSGKGGVGKTNLALNLGYALYRGHHKVMLMDCDLGLANLDVLLGLTPDKTLQDLLTQDVDPADVVVPIEQGGFDFLPSASGVPELIDLDEDLQGLLFDKLNNVLSGYDFLLLDLGAGISRTVMRFSAMTQERIVIITPEPTSLTDGYAMIKVMNSEHGVKNFHVVVNMATDHEEGKRSFQRLHAACERFLGLDIKYAGTVRQDPTLIQAVIKQTPLLKMAPSCNAGRDILQLAVRLKRMRDARLPELGDQEGLSLPQENNTD